MQCIPASHLPLHQERVESESRPDLLTTRVSLPLSLSPSLTGTLCDRPAHTIKFMTTPTENRPEDPKSPGLLFDGSFNFSDAYFDSGALHYLCKLFNPSSSIFNRHPPSPLYSVFPGLLCFPPFSSIILTQLTLLNVQR